LTTYKFKEVILPFNYNLIQSLTRIYGLGMAKASNFIESLGFGKTYSMNEINNYFMNVITVLLKSKFTLGYRIKEIILQRLEYFYENNFVKGVRLFNGLPVNGQRTHSNHATPKREKPFSEKFNAIILEKKRQLLEFAKRRQKRKK